MLRYDDLGATRVEIGDDRVAIESLVGQQRVEFDTCNQWGDADGIEAVPRQEEKADEVAERIRQRQGLRGHATLGAAYGLALSPPCMGFMMSSVISSKRPWIAEQDRYRPRCFKCGTLPHHLVSGRPTGPDQHPTYVGKCEAGKTGPIFLTASKPGGSAVHARPVPSRISLRPPRQNRQVFSVAPSGTRPSVT